MTEEKASELMEEIGRTVILGIFPKYVRENTDISDCFNALTQAYLAMEMTGLRRFTKMSRIDSAAYIIRNVRWFEAQVKERYNLDEKEMKEVKRRALICPEPEGANA